MFKASSYQSRLGFLKAVPHLNMGGAQHRSRYVDFTAKALGAAPSLRLHDRSYESRRSPRSRPPPPTPPDPASSTACAIRTTRRRPDDRSHLQYVVLRGAAAAPAGLREDRRIPGEQSLDIRAARAEPAVSRKRRKGRSAKLFPLHNNSPEMFCEAQALFEAVRSVLHSSSSCCRTCAAFRPVWMRLDILTRTR